MIDSLWEHICVHDVPLPDVLTWDRREALEVLVWYIRDCLEEWFVNDGHMSAISIVRLSTCSHELMLEIRQTGGIAPVYFEELRALSQRVLRRVRVREARRTIACVCTTTSDVVNSE